MRGSAHGRVRLLAATVIAAGLYVLSGQSQASAQQAARRISCTTDEECQGYCEFKYHTQNVVGICNSPGGDCSCYF